MSHITDVSGPRRDASPRRAAMTLPAAVSHDPAQSRPRRPPAVPPRVGGMLGLVALLTVVFGWLRRGCRLETPQCLQPVSRRQVDRILVAETLPPHRLAALLAIACVIRLDSPGPILFRKRRTGFNQRDFMVLKFRTMHHAAADPDMRWQAWCGEPRVTRVGAFLRKTSLDELPQIFNILAGNMSFVGPRAHAPGTRAGALILVCTAVAVLRMRNAC